MTKIEWKGQRVFEATPPTGNKFVMDAYPDAGGHDLGPTPIEAFVASAAACSAIDVLQILEARHQVITGYWVEVEGVRGEGDAYPRPFVKLTFRHILEGVDLEADAVEYAVRESDEKYCTAIATLRAATEVLSVCEVRAAAPWYRKSEDAD